MEYIMLQSMEWYRGKELSQAPFETPHPVESSPVVTHTKVDRGNSESESAPDEREAQLEHWMEDIKAFIRNIDVKKL